MMNWARIILGGLVAGAIITAGDWAAQFTVAAEFNDRVRALGLLIGPLAVTAFLIFGFLIGIVAIWLYAAIRPRYGAGVRTAVIAGVAVWVLAGLIGWGYPTGLDLVTRTEYFMLAAWSLVEIVVATVVGAWLYREEGAGTTTGYAG